MDEHESLNHSKWECEYRCFHSEVPRKDVVRPVAAIPRGGIPEGAEQKERRIENEHLMSDHVHLMISIPPKYAVSQVIGFIKGKSAISAASAPPCSTGQNHCAEVPGASSAVSRGRQDRRARTEDGG